MPRVCAGILVRCEQAIRLSWCGTGGCPYTRGALAAAGRAGGGLSGGKAGTWAEMAEAEDAASGRTSSILEAEREKARKRAERFDIDYKPPTKKAIAGLSRKDQLQMRREEAEAKRDGFVTGRGCHCLLAEVPSPKVRAATLH